MVFWLAKHQEVVRGRMRSSQPPTRSHDEKKCKQEGAIALLIWVFSTDGLYTYYVQPPERAQLLCKGGREGKGGSHRGLVLHWMSLRQNGDLVKSGSVLITHW